MKLTRQERDELKQEIADQIERIRDCPIGSYVVVQTDDVPLLGIVENVTIKNEKPIFKVRLIDSIHENAILDVNYGDIASAEYFRKKHKGIIG